MKLMGIEFAPLLIPLERRMQTFAVFYFTFSMMLGLTLTVPLIYLLFTKYYFIVVLYLLWMIYDHDIHNCGGRRWDRYRRLKIWSHFRDYFPVTMVKTSNLDPHKNYIMGCHPHGIMCFGAFSCFCTEGTNFSQVFPGIKSHIALLEGLFRFPIHREQCLFVGSCSATKKSIEWLLQKEGKGNAVVIVVGGASEALEYHPPNITLVLNKRKGFVKLALMNGASLVPVISFGENDLYRQIANPQGSVLRKVQDKLKKLFGFSIPLFLGRGIFQYSIGILPHRKPITVVIGKPIDVEKVDNPTNEEISKLHQQYVEELVNLFETHKAKYGPGLQLNII